MRIMWPRVWSSLSMTNMAALGTLVSLITTTFSRLPSSGIRQQSKSSGLFVIGAARGEADDLARVRAGAAPLPPTRGAGEGNSGRDTPGMRVLLTYFPAMIHSSETPRSRHAKRHQTVRHIKLEQWQLLPLLGDAIVEDLLEEQAAELDAMFEDFSKLIVRNV